MNKIDDCHKIVEGYLNTHKEEPTIPVSINEQVNFLIARAYIEGYSAGRDSVVELIIKDTGDKND